MILHCREAPPCLSRPNGMGGELHISAVDKPSEEIAGEIKKRIKDETDLTCSIGIAPNKLLAKMASDMQKPDGLTIITEDDIESRIWPLPVRKLWGIGPKTEAYLKEMGIKTKCGPHEDSERDFPGRGQILEEDNLIFHIDKKMIFSIVNSASLMPAPKSKW